jgi:hypothetical protein
LVLFAWFGGPFTSPASASPADTHEGGRAEDNRDQSLHDQSSFLALLDPSRTILLPG